VVLFGIQNRNFGFYLAANTRILIGGRARGPALGWRHNAGWFQGSSHFLAGASLSVRSISKTRSDS
jgi:hypothetical protein